MDPPVIGDEPNFSPPRHQGRFAPAPRPPLFVHHGGRQFPVKGAIVPFPSQQGRYARQEGRKVAKGVPVNASVTPFAARSRRFMAIRASTRSIRVRTRSFNALISEVGRSQEIVGDHARSEPGLSHPSHRSYSEGPGTAWPKPRPHYSAHALIHH